MYLRNVISLNVTLLNVRIIFLLLAFVHLVVTAVVTLSIDTTVDDDPKVRAYYYVRWKLITCWFNLVTLAYLPLRLYCEWKTKQGEGEDALVKRINHVTDVVFTGILFPIVVPYIQCIMTALLAGTGWFRIKLNKVIVGITTYHAGIADNKVFRRYVLDNLQHRSRFTSPASCFHYLPNWAQHSLHTVSFFVILLDIVLTPRRRPKTLIPRLVVLLAFSLSYASMIISNYIRGEMIYKFFEAISGLPLLLIFVMFNTVILVLFLLQWVAIDYLWDSKAVEKLA